MLDIIRRRIFFFQFSMKNINIKMCRTLVWPVVFSYTLREEHRLKVFENRVLWKMLGPKRTR